MFKKSFACVAALAAIGFLGGEAEAKASKRDTLRYPVMEALMTIAGGDLYWKSYKTKTKDDYILTMFRIEGVDRFVPLANSGSKGPMLFLHGFSSDSLTWLNRSDREALAVGSKYAQEGYDVWFGNWRGNKFSR